MLENRRVSSLQAMLRVMVGYRRVSNRKHAARDVGQSASIQSASMLRVMLAYQRVSSQQTHDVGKSASIQSADTLRVMLENRRVSSQQTRCA
jgi:hypothetical protein